MSTRRDFISRAVLAGVSAVVSGEGDASTDATGAGASIAPVRKGAPGKGIARIKTAIRREETTLRYGGNGDNWHMSWGADDRQYVSLCDGAGFDERPRMSYNSRMFVISGGPNEARFDDLPGYPLLGTPKQRLTDPRYYNYGTLAVDGRLYQFMSTFNRPFGTGKAEDRREALRFNGTKLIYSSDNGRTWCNQNGSKPVVWEGWNERSRRTMVFFDEDQEAFSLLSVLQMGKGYEANRDGYIYVYSPNGNTDGTMNELVMFRVRKEKLLERKHYEYFSGSERGPVWTKDIDARTVVHTFPKGWVNTTLHPYSWQPSVVFNEPLGLYMMANWGTGCSSDGVWFAKPSYFGIWVAHYPWGPWTQVHEELQWLPAGDRGARAYQPQIAPKWISADGQSFWLVWTDFQGANDARFKDFREQYSRKQAINAIGEEDVLQNVEMMRRYMPYYAFNVQRVDLVLT